MSKQPGGIRRAVEAMPLPGFANALAPSCDSGRWPNESLRPIAPSQARAAKLQVALYREMLRGLPALTDDQVSTAIVLDMQR